MPVLMRARATLSACARQLGNEAPGKRALLIPTRSNRHCDTHYHWLPCSDMDLAKACPIPVDSLDSPHTKAHLLFQAHFSRLQLPSSDYITDLKSVLDQAIRILQAIIDIVANQGWLAPALSGIVLLQMIIQARWHSENTLLTLPLVDNSVLEDFASVSVHSLPEAMHLVAHSPKVLEKALQGRLKERGFQQVGIFCVFFL
ncbi:hypothetical protein HPB51_015563 [Rhipicephalus microplus]|uniref:SEC63 domain-containing protein n=1 Tax=Rhipicephalus microplus TaxID=6941 RepID=A0A9J6DGY8_RHIMP|nr:hypothetical protein HPB51_015563 [Rhipicephalus microplus]